MQNWKTSLIGLAKVLAALVYVGTKAAHGQQLTELDSGIVAAALVSALGNFLGADAAAVKKLTVEAKADKAEMEEIKKG